MAKYSAVASLMACVALSIAYPMMTSAELPGDKPVEAGEPESAVTDLVEKFLRSASPSELRKLKNEATMVKAAADLTKHFQRSAINKRVVMEVKVAVAEPTPEARNAFRIGPGTLPVKWKDETMDLLSWFYFPNGEAPELKGVTVGSDVVVAGVVRRCEIVIADGRPRFDFDLWKATIRRRK
jgi:hypothetical protein